MMSQIKISKKEKIGISIAALVIVLAAADRLIYMPLNDAFAHINREIKTAEKQLAYSLHNLNQKGRMTAEYRTYGLQPKKNSSDDEKIASMLGEIERLAKKSGMSLVDIKPQPTVHIDFYKELIVEVNARGPMEDLVKFLYDLHGSPLLLRAQSLHLDLKAKNSSTMDALIRVTKISI